MANRLLNGAMPCARTPPSWRGLLVATLLAISQVVASTPASADPPAADETTRVIVQLDVPFAPEGLLTARNAALQRGEIATAQLRLASELVGANHRVRRAYESVPYLALEVDANALERLKRSPRVLRIEVDRLLTPSLLQSRPLVRADEAAAAGYDGAGEVVVVLDTGVDGVHPNLAGKVVGEACFASLGPGPNNGDCPNGTDTQTGTGAGIYCTFSDDCFHGTHVAGIAVGQGSTKSGIAAGADLISIQVASMGSGATCGSNPSPCPTILVSDQIAALDYVFTSLLSQHDISSVNMSFGGGPYTSQSACDSANAATKAVIDNLRSAGVASVVAAGNNGLSDAISEPACISSAVSVGAVNDLDLVRSWSNAASFLSLWAPGEGISAPNYQTNGFASHSGTSMAAPHVAGAFAILRSADATASVSTLLTALTSTGQAVTHANANTVRFDVMAALESLVDFCDDGIDNDGDGLIDFGADPGCDSATDDSERSDSLVCDDGIDNDGDGGTDYDPATFADATQGGGDPACANPSSATEAPQCQDGINNDSDGRTDFDGGQFIHGACTPGTGGCPAGVSDPDDDGVADPDPDCIDRPWWTRESPKRSSCGSGAELAFLVPALLAARLRRRSAKAADFPR